MFEPNCQICLGVYIEPVVLPCDHCVCKPCFDQIVNKSNTQCPFCRRRIGSWARLSARNGTIVHAERWEYMRKHYADEVTARLNGALTPKKAKGRCRTRSNKLN